MAAQTVYTKDEIESINRQRSAIKGKTYKDTDGNEYIGIDNGWLVIKDTAANTVYSSENETSVESEIEEVNEEIESIEKTIEIRETEIREDKSNDFTQSFLFS